MNKYIPIEKRSKRAQREHNKAQRKPLDFMGSRPMKTDKKPSRARQKEMWRAEEN